MGRRAVQTNHDDAPIEVLRLWLAIEGEQPREIKQERLEGRRRIEARSRERYDLRFDAVYGSPPAEHERDLSDEEILERLLALNLERVAEKGGDSLRRVVDSPTEA